MTGLTALVLAAGMSVRMGKPKMVLPWRGSSIIGTVIEVLKTSGINDIVVVTGGSREAVEEILIPLHVKIVHNPDYQNGEMLDSYRAGLAAMEGTCQAVLITLGDQPQIQAETVRVVMDAWVHDPDKIIVPSYQMRRGHPWILPRRLWGELTSLRPPQTMRDFMRTQQDEIVYVNVDTPTVLADVDTPEDYERAVGSG